MTKLNGFVTEPAQSRGRTRTIRTNPGLTDLPFGALAKGVLRRTGRCSTFPRAANQPRRTKPGGVGKRAIGFSANTPYTSLGCIAAFPGRVNRVTGHRRTGRALGAIISQRTGIPALRAGHRRAHSTDALVSPGAESGRPGGRTNVVRQNQTAVPRNTSCVPRTEPTGTIF